VILDEILMTTWLRMLEIQDLIDLVEIKSLQVELALTDRWAPQELIDRAGLVTEMREVKHCYRQGVPARKGIAS